MVYMENALSEPVGLTVCQNKVLNEIVRDRYFLDIFYLSGGTALSSWYLNHRESYDLDFFCDTPLDYDRIMRWFHHNEQVIDYESIRFDQDYGFYFAFYDLRIMMY